MTPAATTSPSFSTCDLCDLHKAASDGGVRALFSAYASYGALERFCGPISTVRCYEDNTMVKQVLAEPGLGRVLVIDGAGSLRRALVGGNIAASAASQGWAGVVVHGAVRDVAELAATPIGLRALALCPMPSVRGGQGQRDLPVQINGVWLRPGEWLYADADGIIVATTALI